VVVGSFAYVVNSQSNTLQVFNISNPAAPTLAGSVATGLYPSFIAVSGSFAYVTTAISETLQLFDISNPAAPTLARSVSSSTDPFCVAVSGSFACAVCYSTNTLRVFKAISVGFDTPLAASSMPSSGNWSLLSNLNIDSGTLALNPITNSVGIGIATPEAPLHLSAPNLAAANDWMLRVTNIAANTTGGLRITDNDFLEMTNKVASFTGVARLNATGAWTVSSDRRLKRDIQPAIGNLDAALLLRPVTYAMNGDKPATPRHLGFIAQEVRDVLPTFVIGDEAKTTLSVNYAQMSVVAIGAIQEQQARIDALARENADLKARLERLERAVEALAKRK
jgi:hypothetical protein